MNIQATIDSDRLGEVMRSRVFKAETLQLLIADLRDTLEAKDDYTKINCNGLGRTRTFANYRMHADGGDPVERARLGRVLLDGYPRRPTTTTQVFQLAGCAWRCWYCYVDESRLSGDPRTSRWLTCDELTEMYSALTEPPDIIDLSGGQPDLVPAWPRLMLGALRRSGSADSVYLRSEDNLTFPLTSNSINSELWQELIEWGRYSRIGCFKGYDHASFSANTGARPEFFDRQFETARTIIENGLSFFAYATFTSLPHAGIRGSMSLFFDRLQAIHYYLPLRIVPLLIRPVPNWGARRISNEAELLSGQSIAVDAWFEEICRRFTLNERDREFELISLRP